MHELLWCKALVSIKERIKWQVQQCPQLWTPGWKRPRAPRSISHPTAAVEGTREQGQAPASAGRQDSASPYMPLAGTGEWRTTQNWVFQGTLDAPKADSILRADDLIMMSDTGYEAVSSITQQLTSRTQVRRAILMKASKVEQCVLPRVMKPCALILQKWGTRSQH